MLGSDHWLLITNADCLFNFAASSRELKPKRLNGKANLLSNQNYPNLGKTYTNANGIEMIENAFPNKTIAATLAGSCS